uniref:PB1 domain-containing protein n=1 Tax=Parastrongyloides trichosuri TaxID=131310 RepID=A0A0N4Z2M2_PARTI
MNSNGFTQIVVKTKYGNDIRKQILGHNEDLTLTSLQVFIQRIYKIESNASIILKYRDSDGDFVTLNDDNDVLFAIRNEPKLFIEVSNDLSGACEGKKFFELLTEAQKKLDSAVSAFQRCHKKTSNKVEHSEKDFSVSRPETPSKVADNIATIQPSVQEFIQPCPLSQQNTIQNSFEENVKLQNPQHGGSGTTESADSNAEQDVPDHTSDISAFEQLNLNEPNSKGDSESTLNGFNKVKKEDVPQNPYAHVQPMQHFNQNAPQPPQTFNPPPSQQFQPSQTPTPQHFYQQQQQQQTVPSPYQQNTASNLNQGIPPPPTQYGMGSQNIPQNVVQPQQHQAPQFSQPGAPQQPRQYQPPFQQQQQIPPQQQQPQQQVPQQFPPQAPSPYQQQQQQPMSHPPTPAQPQQHQMPGHGSFPGGATAPPPSMPPMGGMNQPGMNPFARPNQGPPTYSRPNFSKQF